MTHFSTGLHRCQGRKKCVYSTKRQFTTQLNRIKVCFNKTFNQKEQKELSAVEMDAGRMKRVLYFDYLFNFYVNRTIRSHKTIRSWQL